MPAILFVCTANQCRSPVAAALLCRYLQHAPQPSLWQIESAGTWAQRGRPAHPAMVTAAQRVGLDLKQHRARRIEDLANLAAFDLILTMERGQQEALQTEFPRLQPRIHLLSALVGATYDVHDPVGGSAEQYRHTIDEIDRLLQSGFSTLLSLLPSRSTSPPAT